MSVLQSVPPRHALHRSHGSGTLAAPVEIQHAVGDELLMDPLTDARIDLGHSTRSIPETTAQPLPTAGTVQHVVPERTAANRSERRINPVDERGIDQSDSSESCPRPWPAQTFQFDEQSWLWGAYHSCGAFLLSLLGVMVIGVAAHVETGNAGRAGILIVAAMILAVLLGLGVMFAAFAARSLGGSLTVTEGHVVMSPLWIGFTLPISELHAWKVQMDTAGGPSVTLNTTDDRVYAIPAGLLSDEQLVRVRHALNCVAPRRPRV